MQCRRSIFAVLALVLPAVSMTTEVDAKGKSKSPVVGVVTEGIAERTGATPKKKGKKKTSTEVGKVYTALCEGTVASYKVTELGDDGSWVGGFVGPVKPKRCMLLDAPAEPGMAAKGRPNPTTAQISAAKAAAATALAGKEPIGKVEITVFHDGESLVAVAQTTRAAGAKSACMDHSSLVVLTEHDGVWKSAFKPSLKGKDICGFSYFTRGDIDADGKDEIALRVDRAEGYGYRVLRKSKGTYSVVGK